MLEEISSTGKLTLQDCLDYNHYYFRCILRPAVLILLGAFSLLLAALLVCLGIKTHFTLFIVSVLALCAYFPLGWIAHRRFAVVRSYHRRAKDMVENTIMFTDQAISLTSAPADWRLSWDRLSAIVSTPRGLLFLLPGKRTPRPLFWLPERVFEGNSHKQAILEHAASCKIRVRQMR